MHVCVTPIWTRILRQDDNTFHIDWKDQDKREIFKNLQERDNISTEIYRVTTEKGITALVTAQSVRIDASRKAQTRNQSIKASVSLSRGVPIVLHMLLLALILRRATEPSDNRCAWTRALACIRGGVVCNYRYIYARCLWTERRMFLCNIGRGYCVEWRFVWILMYMEGGWLGGNWKVVSHNFNLLE